MSDTEPKAIMGYDLAELEELSQEDLDRLLVTACKQGDLDNVRILYDNFANIHARHNSPLHQAVLEGHDDIARWLVEQGVDIDRDSMRYAAERGNLGLVKFFHETDADSASDWFLKNATAKAGQVEVLRYLHEQGVDLRGDDDFVIGCAAEGGSLETLKFYIEELGADIKARDERAFYEAVHNGHRDVVDYIIELNGGKLSKRMTESVHWAQSYGHSDLVKHMIEDYGFDPSWNDSGLVKQAAMDGDLKFLKYLVGKGADPNAEDDDALRNAAMKGHLDVVKYLVEECGADANAGDVSRAPEPKKGLKDYAGKLFGRKQRGERRLNTVRTVLAEAAMHGHVPVVDYLISKGADVRANDDAAFYGVLDDSRENYSGNMNVKNPAKTPVLEKLLAHAPRAAVEDGHAMGWAIKNGRQDLFDAAAAAGADVKGKAFDGLRFSLYNGNTGLARYFIETHGADINADTKELFRAVGYSNDTAFLGYLMDKGMDVRELQKTQPKLVADLRRAKIEYKKQKEAEARAAEEREQALKTVRKKGRAAPKLK